MDAQQNTAKEILVSPEDGHVITRIDGVIIGVLLGLGQDGAPLVAFAGNPQEAGVKARTSAKLHDSDVGREVALLFEGGDPRLPLLIGLIHKPDSKLAETSSSPTAHLDGERIVLSADKEIVLNCGKASITLTRAGKILIRGAYLLSRSSGANRVKGASVQLN